MMKQLLKMRAGIIVLIILALLGAVRTEIMAQKVPISFDQFHGFTGTQKYLKEVSKAYPDITKLVTITTPTAYK